MPRHPLTAAEIAAALPPGWTGDERAIWREWTFPSYPAGVDFAVRVAALAERLDHHPELVLTYRRVRVSFWTHDAGGVTLRDMEAARAVEALTLRPFGPPPSP